MGGWRTKTSARLRAANELHLDFFELYKSGEALAAACMGRQGDPKWNELYTDLSLKLFKPTADQVSDFAFAYNFVLEAVERNEIADDNVDDLLKIADQRLAEGSAKLSELRQVRDEFIIRVRVLAGSDPDTARKAVFWGEDVKKKLEERTTMLLSRP